MTFLAHQSAIDTYMTTNWSYTSIARDNVNFNPSLVSEWVRVTVSDGNTRQSAMGAKRSYRFYGLVTIQIFVAVDSGTGRALVLADNAFNLFNVKQIGSAQFQVPTVTRLGSPDGQWYQINVDCPYQREEFEP